MRARRRRLAPTPPATTSVRASVASSARRHLMTSVSTTASSKACAASARVWSSQFAVAQRDDHGRLEAAEAEIEPRPLGQRTREPEHAGATALGQRRKLRTARIAEAEQLRGLVEGLARPRRRATGRGSRTGRRRERARAACGHRRPAARRTETAAGPARAAARAGALPCGGPPCRAPARHRRGCGPPRLRPAARPRDPGPLVYATPWIAAAPPLSASTFFNKGNNLRRWSREASSGTTPP